MLRWPAWWRRSVLTGRLRSWRSARSMRATASCGPSAMSAASGAHSSGSTRREHVERERLVVAVFVDVVGPGFLERLAGQPIWALGCVRRRRRR